MLRHIASAFHRFTTHRNTRTKRFARLEVLVLEERATPAVDFLAPIDVPTMVVVAPLAGAIEQSDAQPTYRLDLLPACSSTKTESIFEPEETEEAKAEPDSSSESDETSENKLDEENEEALIRAMEEELLRMMSEGDA